MSYAEPSGIEEKTFISLWCRTQSLPLGSFPRAVALQEIMRPYFNPRLFIYGVIRFLLKLLPNYQKNTAI